MGQKLEELSFPTRQGIFNIPASYKFHGGPQIGQLDRHTNKQIVFDSVEDCQVPIFLDIPIVETNFRCVRVCVSLTGPRAQHWCYLIRRPRACV